MGHPKSECLCVWLEEGHYGFCLARKQVGGQRRTDMFVQSPLASGRVRER